MIYVTPNNRYPTRNVDVTRQRAPTASPRAGVGTPVPGRAGQHKPVVAWAAPLTADGRPDLQGMWLNNTATPLQREKDFAEKAFFTEDEALDYETHYLLDRAGSSMRASRSSWRLVPTSTRLTGVTSCQTDAPPWLLIRPTEEFRR